MSDYSELKKLAEASVGFDDISLAPDVVLALIAENEALRTQLSEQAAISNDLAQEASDANEQILELRKDAERYQFLKNLPDDQYLIERLECATDPENWDAAIDAAMAKEAIQ